MDDEFEIGGVWLFGELEFDCGVYIEMFLSIEFNNFLLSLLLFVEVKEALLEFLFLMTSVFSDNGLIVPCSF